MTIYLSDQDPHCMSPVDERPRCAPRRGIETVGIYPSRWLAERAQREHARHDLWPFYEVAETERGWELLYTEKQP